MVEDLVATDIASEHYQAALPKHCIDTLSGIEGAVRPSAADISQREAPAGAFQGGLGKDAVVNDGGRYSCDFDGVAESGTGTTTRDLIPEFAAASAGFEIGVARFRALIAADFCRDPKGPDSDLIQINAALARPE